MFSLFKKDPLKTLEKEIKVKLEKARDIQRSGDIKAYALAMGEIDELQKKLDQMRSGVE
ncbi:MAG: Lacal_2735 family protein [Saprospiraceae bacterium]|nr:Lacal_2735 family protein [Saprospiraceae bacterium]